MGSSLLFRTWNCCCCLCILYFKGLCPGGPQLRPPPLSFAEMVVFPRISTETGTAKESTTAPARIASPYLLLPLDRPCHHCREGAQIICMALRQTVLICQAPQAIVCQRERGHHKNAAGKNQCLGVMLSPCPCWVLHKYSHRVYEERKEQKKRELSFLGAHGELSPTQTGSLAVTQGYFVRLQHRSCISGAVKFHKEQCHCWSTQWS